MVLKLLLCCASASAWLASFCFFRGAALLAVLALGVVVDIQSILGFVRSIRAGVSYFFVAIRGALEPGLTVAAKLGWYFESWPPKLSSRAAMAETLTAVVGELKEGLIWAYEDCWSLAVVIAMDFMANYAEAEEFIWSSASCMILGS